MIYIERNRRDEDGNQIQPNAEWFLSAHNATEITKRETRDHVVKRNVYAHEQVQIALEELFHGKCAYCESDLRNSEWDVEHFRPKGRVAESSNHHGYYWLAYDWTNLYPACKFCNQRRRDKPRWGDLGEVHSGGKADQFPLTDEATRVISHEQAHLLAKEQNLLLDPCKDFPQEFLRFGVKGQIHGIDLGGRGKATVDICHLRRKRLKDLRVCVIQELWNLLALAHKLESDGSANAVADTLNYLQSQAAKDSQPYISVVRYALSHPDEFGF